MLKLRELRKKCGLTMKELGAEIGVAESTISQYETGKREPDYETLLKLAEYFGTSVDVLLRGEPQDASPAKPVILDKELDGINFALYGEIQELSDEDKQDILEFIRFKKSQRKSKG